MDLPRCGAHCGLDREGLSDCIPCELHGLCHMCVEEDWAKKFEGIKKENIQLRKDASKWKKMALAAHDCLGYMSQDIKKKEDGDRIANEFNEAWRSVGELSGNNE